MKKEEKGSCKTWEYGSGWVEGSGWSGDDLQGFDFFTLAQN